MTFISTIPKKLTNWDSPLSLKRFVCCFCYVTSLRTVVFSTTLAQITLHDWQLFFAPYLVIVSFFFWLWALPYLILFYEGLASCLYLIYLFIYLCIVLFMLLKAGVDIGVKKNIVFRWQPPAGHDVSILHLSFISSLKRHVVFWGRLSLASNRHVPFLIIVISPA